jgi:PDZ domain
MLTALHNVVAGFLRRTWLVAIASVLVCASFAARAVAALSETTLAPDAAAATRPAPPAPTRAPAPPRPPKNGDVFANRNIFCSSCTPAAKSAPGGGTYEGHPAVLIATSIGPEPRATVRVVPTEVQGSWGLGEDIPGVGRIEEIYPTSIEVADASGNTKQISLRDAAAGPGAATLKDPPPPSPASPWAGRITKLGEEKYEIERSLIRELVMGGAKPGMGGANPVVVDGDVRGVGLIRIGPRSPAYELGLRSGDLIESVDGVPLKSAQVALDLFAKLNQVSSVEVEGTRRAGGKPFKLTLQLR